MTNALAEEHGQNARKVAGCEVVVNDKTIRVKYQGSYGLPTVKARLKSETRMPFDQDPDGDTNW